MYSLAYAELYLVLAGLFRRFEFKLYETTVEDVKMVRDMFVSAPASESKGVRVVIVGEVD